MSALSLEDRQQYRLLQYCRYNTVAVLVAVAALAMLRVTVVPSDWVEFIIFLLLALAAALILSAGLVRRGRIWTALTVITGSNWALMLAITAVVPFALKVLPLAALLPALLVIPHLDRRSTQATFAATLLVVTTLSLLGRLGDGVGLERVAPLWVLTALELIFVPTVVGLAAYILSKNLAALVLSSEELRQSRERLVAAADRERRRIEQALRDGAQQRLVAVTMHLKVAQQVAAHQPALISPLLDRASQTIQTAVEELRDIGHGIYPPQLADHGLLVALRSATRQRPTLVTLIGSNLRRYDAEIETNLYFICLEAIENAAQHAGPDASITVTLVDDHGLTATVTDTGCGTTLEALRSGLGVMNMTDRAGAIGGTLTFDTGPGRGLRMSAHVPARRLTSEGARPWRRSVGLMSLLWRILDRIDKRYQHTPDDAFTAGIRQQIIAVSGGVLLGLIMFALLPSPWILVTLIVGMSAGLALGCAIKLVEAGRARAAQITLVAALSVSAACITAMIPTSLYYTPMIVIMPVLLSAMRDHTTIRPLVAVAVLVAGVEVVLASYSPGVGLERLAPEWLADLYVVAFLIMSSFMLLVSSMENYAVVSSLAEELRKSRERLVLAADRERRRTERDLHDGAQQHLVAVAMQLRVAQRAAAQENAESRALVGPLLDQAFETVQRAAAELRDLAHGIYPMQLSQQGLGAALSAAAEFCPLPLSVSARNLARYPREVETNVYFACLEAVQNAVKHAGPDAVITIELEGTGGLRATVTDTGPGTTLAALRAGHGVLNIIDRIAAVGGRLTLATAPGRGVSIRTEVPGLTALPDQRSWSSAPWAGRVLWVSRGDARHSASPSREIHG